MTTPFEPTSVSTDATQGNNAAQNAQFSSQQATVNGAQAFAIPSQQQQQQPSLAESERANFQARINNLMSEKDRAINERDKKIGELAALQNEYTQYKEMNSGSLNSAVDAGQRLVEENKKLQVEVTSLKGQVIRANVLMQKPHLAAYQEFIPANASEEELNNAINKLEQIRQADLQRNGAMFPPSSQGQVGQGQQQGQVGQGQQGQAALDPATIIGNLYQGRANLPQSLVQAQTIGSTPSQMNPNGDLSPTARIQRLFDDAKASSNPNAYQDAVAQAAVLANSMIAQQMNGGR